MEFDDAGDLYVAEAGYSYGDPSAPARVLRVTPAGEIRVVAEDLNGPVTDLLWAEGGLYSSHRGKISALRDGQVRDLVTGLPSLGDHHNNQIARGPDGKLYFGEGTVTNSGVVGVRRSIFALSPWSNPFLFAAPGAALLVHVAALYLAPTQFLLRVEPLDLGAWVRWSRSRRRSWSRWRRTSCSGAALGCHVRPGRRADCPNA